MSILHKSIDWLERRLNLSEIFSWITTFGISYAPLNPNSPFREIVREAFLKPLPSYQWPHMLGLLMFVTFLIELATGLLLAFYFQPATGVAYESTRLIIRDTSFGWYIHQMHFWGAQILLVLVLLRLLRFILQRVYQPPRELTWVFGWIILALTIPACFTGGLLPWNQESYWSTLRGLELLNKIPVVGSVLKYFVGGFIIDGFLMHRFYLLHIIFLPVLLLFFFYLHFATVRRVGLSPIPAVEEKTSPVYPTHLMNLLMMMLILFGGILTLAVLLPSSFLEQADPYSTPSGFSVAWYLLPLYGFFVLFPTVVAGWILFLAFWILLFLPFVHRWADQVIKSRLLLKIMGIAVFLFILYVTYVGYRQKG